MSHLSRILSRTVLGIVAICLGTVGVTVAAYASYFSERIVPGTMLGVVSLGGLHRDAAAVRLQDALDVFVRDGIVVVVQGNREVIQPDAIGLDLNIAEAVDRAYARGHQGSWFTRTQERVSALWSRTHVETPVTLDEEALANEVGDIALASDIARRDVRLVVEGSVVTLATDTRPGRIIDRADAVRRITSSLYALQATSTELMLVDDIPHADPTKAQDALVAARHIAARSLTLAYEDLQFYIARDRIASWLTSAYDGDLLRADIDRQKVAQYVTGIAKSLNIDPVPPQITTDGGRVTGFVPPKVGRAVEEDALAGLMIATLASRTGDNRMSDTIVVPMRTSNVAIQGLNADSGITELIGRATTPFTGSPKNRISNIKNGVKFLSGSVIQPGDEFSTLGTLGTIDNTTGYLPELVIKGDRTLPEYGGGLCQVSTTLFRAVLNAGLPVTERRNHSYRVSYYEKDGNGTFIGPGLDATIYEPDPDFRFRNDTAHPILIIGYVIGDKISFELYGTGDGRSSQIIGPTLLTETAPGEPVYIETTDLAPGIIKQVETPHPGGSTVATYIITYPDGHKESQEFKSYYRRWPAKYLKGVLVLSSPAQTPTSDVGTTSTP